MRPTWPPGTRGISRCAPACWRCGLADVARPRRRDAPRRLSSGAAALHRLQCRQPPAGGGVGRRDRAAPGASAHRHGRQGGIRRDSSCARSRASFAGAPPEELAEAVERGLAEAPQVNIPILSGHCEVAQRIAERIGLPEEIRESLGQIYERWDGKGMPRGLSGNAVKFPVRRGDAGAGCHRAERRPRLRDHEGDDRQARRRRLRAGAGRSFPRSCRTTARGPRRAGRPRDDPGAGARLRIRCSTRRLATKPIWPSPI